MHDGATLSLAQIAEVAHGEASKESSGLAV
jgi:hypothetical protein